MNNCADSCTDSLSQLTVVHQQKLDINTGGDIRLQAQRNTGDTGTHIKLSMDSGDQRKEASTVTLLRSQLPAYGLPPAAVLACQQVAHFWQRRHTPPLPSLLWPAPSAPASEDGATRLGAISTQCTCWIQSQRHRFRSSQPASITNPRKHRARIS
jgi:hypothetical protein